MLLVVNLAWILTPATFGLPDAVAAIKLSFASVAVWWLLFSIPILRRVPEPPPLESTGALRRVSVFRVGFIGAWRTLKELRTYPNAFLLLVAFLLTR